MTQKRPRRPTPVESLRPRAEARLRQSSRPPPRWGGGVQRLVHELDVHREELEMQNEELRAVQRELEASRDRFAALYDAAPVGYLTLDAAGVILESNLTAAALLAMDRPGLLQRKLSRFVARQAQDAFFLHWRQVFSPGARQICELRMRRAGATFDAELRCLPVPGDQIGGRQCRVALSDITERKQMEQQERTSREQLRSLAAHLQAVREEERTRVAREIHDVLAQGLTQLGLDIGWLDQQLTRPLTAAKERLLRDKLALMTNLTDMAAQTVQKIATELRPVILDSLGLCAAIEWQVADFQKRTEIHCRTDVPEEDVPMAHDRATAVFRILQESLTNIARHAGATEVRVGLRLQADQLHLTIRDNGRGIRPSQESDPRSLGLLGMRERALLLDGECRITGRAGTGTVVELRLPLTGAAQPSDHPGCGS